MAQRPRSVLLAAAVCVGLVLTLLLMAAPAPEGLRDRVMRFAAFSKGPEEAAELANEGAGDVDAAANEQDAKGDGDPPPFDPAFYGDFPMFGDMMDFWLQDNLSRLMKNGEHRFGRRELSDEVDLLVDDNDKT